MRLLDSVRLVIIINLKTFFALIRVPPLLEETTKAPTPHAQAALDMLSRPLAVLYSNQTISSEIQSKGMASLIDKIFSQPYTEQIELFVIPGITTYRYFSWTTFEDKNFFTNFRKLYNRSSESLNSYFTLNPRGPNFLLSYAIAWKKLTPKHSFRHTSGFLQLSKKSSDISAQERMRLALIPIGGSVVFLIPF